MLGKPESSQLLPQVPSYHPLATGGHGRSTGLPRAPCSGPCSSSAMTGEWVGRSMQLHPSASGPCEGLTDSNAAHHPVSHSGHQSFSNNRTLNDFVGNVVHSSILVPYHGWRISHRTHHANHGHVENDESWHPVSKGIFDNMVGGGRGVGRGKLGRQGARAQCGALIPCTGVLGQDRAPDPALGHVCVPLLPVEPQPRQGRLALRPQQQPVCARGEALGERRLHYFLTNRCAWHAALSYHCFKLPVY